MPPAGHCKHEGVWGFSIVPVSGCTEYVPGAQRLHAPLPEASMSSTCPDSQTERPRDTSTACAADVIIVRRKLFWLSKP
eukprot:1334780-Rhodomonas_salina.3